MQAAVYTEYGPPDVLELREVERPVPGDDEVLIRVRAVSVNASDWEMLTGRPLYARIWGLFRPKIRILGSDVAGRVEAVGRGVTRFRPGDAVFGDVFERWGGFAEYACAPERALLPKPPGLTFEEAAALPQAAVLALQGLRDRERVGPERQVLVNGAGGGAGSFAVQIARSLGAEVTGVDHTRKLDFMRALGADHVLDYTREDYTRTGRRYDLVLDFVARRPVSAYRRALEPGGRFLMVGGSVGLLLKLLLLGPWHAMTGGKKLGILAWKPNTDDLAAVLDLIEAGQVTPAVDRSFPLSETAEALRYLGEGRARGKVVVTV